MRHLLREPVLALGAALAVFPPATLHFLATERVSFGTASHVLFVGLSAGAATAAAIALTAAGARRGDGRTRALTQLLAERDVSTEEHTRRVAVEVGEEVGLSPERLRVLAAGGLLHDMGKLAVPDAILSKPGALTTAEYEEVKQHPENGRKLLAELGFGADVQRLVLDHHERIDGSGYPRGIEDGALDLETRILGVCDVYYALVSPRVYRNAWTHGEAVRHSRHSPRRIRPALRALPLAV